MKVITSIIIVLSVLSFCSLAYSEPTTTINKGEWHQFELYGFWGNSSANKPKDVSILYSGMPSKEAFTLTLSTPPYFQYVLHFSIDEKDIVIKGFHFKVLEVRPQKIVLEKLKKK